MKPIKHVIAAVALGVGLTGLTGMPAVAADLTQLKEQGFARIAIANEPIEYSYLVFAVAIDFVIWALLPSGTTLIGMFLVVGSGLLITFREWTARQAQINLPS
ncbi:hypothetical protein N9413_10385 [Paracoccaceae bacterium]|nr:hypothetical protein [Paracoccaceae bacterium]